MTTGLRPPPAVYAPVVEWRAHRIKDPVERLRYLRRNAEQRATWRWWQPLVHPWAQRIAAMVLAVLLIPAPTISDGGATWRRAMAQVEAVDAAEKVKNVWSVESNEEYEVFSNGLRVENKYLIAASQPALPRFCRFPGASVIPEWSAAPMGIVYHTSESDIAPFEADKNGYLKRIGEDLLRYVRRHRCYHFVIDRFGRAFRVVPENETADHAGNSTWADSKGVYVNLNHSFLGVAFEAQTKAGDGLPTVNDAQIYTGRILTEMLRSKFRIAAGNCVTHAQVSVNPENRRIGYHTDWAGNFPFSGMGLRDNYSLALPSLYVFGFSYDPAFLKSTGARDWKGLQLSDERVRQEATSQGITVAAYKENLHKQYKTLLRTLRDLGVIEEKN